MEDRGLRLWGQLLPDLLALTREMLGGFCACAVCSIGFYAEDTARLCPILECCKRPEMLSKQLAGSRCGVPSTNSAQPLPSPLQGWEPICHATSASFSRWNKDLWDMSPFALNDSFQTNV